MDVILAIPGVVGVVLGIWASVVTMKRRRKAALEKISDVFVETYAKKGAVDADGRLLPMTIEGCDAIPVRLNALLLIVPGECSPQTSIPQVEYALLVYYTPDPESARAEYRPDQAPLVLPLRFMGVNVYYRQAQPARALATEESA